MHESRTVLVLRPPGYVTTGFCLTRIHNALMLYGERTPPVFWYLRHLGPGDGRSELEMHRRCHLLG